MLLTRYLGRALDSPQSCSWRDAWGGPWTHLTHAPDEMLGEGPGLTSLMLLMRCLGRALDSPHSCSWRDAWGGPCLQPPPLPWRPSPASWPAPHSWRSPSPPAHAEPELTIIDNEESYTSCKWAIKLLNNLVMDFSQWILWTLDSTTSA